MSTGWIMFGVLILVDTAIHVGIQVGFENDFWREDETRKR